MLPEWMKTTDEYAPPAGGSAFAVKSMKTIGKIMARLKVQKGHEKGVHIPGISRSKNCKVSVNEPKRNDCKVSVNELKRNDCKVSVNELKRNDCKASVNELERNDREAASNERKKSTCLPAIVKLIALVLVIVAISICRVPIILMAFAAVLLVYLCTWPARDLWSIVSVSGVAALITLLLMIPAMIIKPAGTMNYAMLVSKVFISVAFVSVFNHTTQWNHITMALRQLHVPGIFVFTLDITLKYIVLMGNLITELLTSYLLRAVGNSKSKQTSAGAVLGVTFLRGTEMNRQMYEAMQCRGFTDDYKGL